MNLGALRSAGIDAATAAPAELTGGGRRAGGGVVADDLWPLPTHREMLFIL